MPVAPSGGHDTIAARPCHTPTTSSDEHRPSRLAPAGYCSARRYGWRPSRLRSSQPVSAPPNINNRRRALTTAATATAAGRRSESVTTPTAGRAPQAHQDRTVPIMSEAANAERAHQPCRRRCCHRRRLSSWIGHDSRRRPSTVSRTRNGRADDLGTRRQMVKK